MSINQLKVMVKESRPYRPFKSSEEYLLALREDLAEWLDDLYPDLHINYVNFWDKLDTGVVLCQHANNVKRAADIFLEGHSQMCTDWDLMAIVRGIRSVNYLKCAKAGTFFARDNVHNFIEWCRHSMQILECLLFESDDLIMRKNEKHVIFCLMEVARLGAKFGMLAPLLVQMEREIDEELKYGASELEDVEDAVPVPQIVTNNLLNLDSMVKNLIEICACPTQFPMVRVGDGKYRIGDSKILIFVRILRNHVMVRVGGGWDTLAHYLDKHDPCRCRSQHRSTLGAKLVSRTTNNGADLNGAQVFYERQPVHRKVYCNQIQHEVMLSPDSDNGSELSDEGYRSLKFITVNDRAPRHQAVPKHKSREWPQARNNSWNGSGSGGDQFRKKKRTPLTNDLYQRQVATARSPLRQAIQLVNESHADQADSDILQRIRELLRQYDFSADESLVEPEPEPQPELQSEPKTHTKVLTRQFPMRKDTHADDSFSRIPIPLFCRRKSLTKN